MSLEKLIVCGCGHTIDHHNHMGCQTRVAESPAVNCRCALPRPEILERMIANESEATRRRWTTRAPESARPG
jgi:hypothetical protein